MRIPVTGTIFQQRRLIFTHMWLKLNNVIKTDPESLKTFFRFHKCPSGLKPRILQCHTTSEILGLICEECSLTNIVLLEQTVTELKIEEAKPIMQRYKAKTRAFLKNLPLRFGLKENFSCRSALKSQRLIFVLNKRVDECTFSDAQEIIEVAFDETSSNVNVVVIKEGNSFTIYCSFPLALSESLIAAALKNIEHLKAKGLLVLKIGYCTVYNYKEVIHFEQLFVSLN